MLRGSHYQSQRQSNEDPGVGTLGARQDFLAGVVSVRLIERDIGRDGFYVTPILRLQPCVYYIGRFFGLEIDTKPENFVVSASVRSGGRGHGIEERALLLREVGFLVVTNNRVISGS